HAILRHLSLRTPKIRVRVVGTNGKGSTAWFLAAALRATGLKVGLYTSPHILRFHERIRIQGREVPDRLLRLAAARVRPYAERYRASWFEAATAIALVCFSKARVDVEILEAGVGGRLDATTAVPADMCLITPIALDHQDWLGESLSAIAREKAYAMRGCAVCLSAPQEPSVRRVLRAFAHGLAFARRWRGPLAARGAFQRINAGLAWAAVERLRALGRIPDRPAAAHRAIARTRVPGRCMRIFYKGAELWLDPAHNAHAARALAKALASAAPLDAAFVYTRADRDPAPIAEVLRRIARRVETSRNPEHAPPRVQAYLGRNPGAKILVCGSFRTVAAMLAAVEDDEGVARR
ncbi:MAG: bifunctional folylpolyglutamate synthase/dihydrofolate synthase, partial [Zetaproteobacteria bacterium]